MKSNSGVKWGVGNETTTGPFHLKLHFINKTILLNFWDTYAFSKIFTFLLQSPRVIQKVFLNEGFP